MKRVKGIRGTSAELYRDETGRDILRVGLKLDPLHEMTAPKLAHWLTEQSPPIYVRPHLLSNGVVLFDPRAMADEDVEAVIGHVKRFCADASRGEMR
jgi:hypothetical protein